MDKIPVYLIAYFNVHKPTEYRKYEKLFFPILKRHGGEFLTYDDDPKTLEGSETVEGRVVLLRFPTEQAALGWYADPEYKEISKYRVAGTTSKYLAMIHGLSPRGR